MPCPCAQNQLQDTSANLWGIIIIIIIRFIKHPRPWLLRCWRQVSRGCYSKALWKKYVLSLDLKTDNESALIIVSGNDFQTVGAEQRKARLAKSVLVNGLSSSGTADEQSVHSLNYHAALLTDGSITYCSFSLRYSCSCYTRAVIV